MEKHFHQKWKYQYLYDDSTFRAGRKGAVSCRRGGTHRGFCPRTFHLRLPPSHLRAGFLSALPASEVLQEGVSAFPAFARIRPSGVGTPCGPVHPAPSRPQKPGPEHGARGLGHSALGRHLKFPPSCRRRGNVYFHLEEGDKSRNVRAKAK